MVLAVTSNPYLGWFSSQLLQVVQSIKEEIVSRGGSHPVGPAVCLNGERHERLRNKRRDCRRCCQRYQNIKTGSKLAEEQEQKNVIREQKSVVREQKAGHFTTVSFEKTRLLYTAAKRDFIIGFLVSRP